LDLSVKRTYNIYPTNNVYDTMMSPPEPAKRKPIMAGCQDGRREMVQKEIKARK
jgi:hypothetical protein